MLRIHVVRLKHGAGDISRVEHLVARPEPTGLRANLFHNPGGATLGFDLRFEKPVATYVTVGGLISNYWLRAPRNRNTPTGIDISAINPG